MANEQKGSGAIQRSKVGRFQISVWQVSRLFRARGDFGVEREFISLRACLRYNRFNHRQNGWENQTIWFNSEELRDLSLAIDQLKFSEGAGVFAPSPASCPASEIRG